MLANVVRKPMQQIFSEFTGIKSGDQGSFTGSGDVKYHLGTSYDRPTITGKRVHLSLLANPSHLEVCQSPPLPRLSVSMTWILLVLVVAFMVAVRVYSIATPYAPQRHCICMHVELSIALCSACLHGKTV